MIVLDASALLALIHGEPGQEVVARHISRASISAINLSEVAAKLQERGSSEAQAMEDILIFRLDIHPFDTAQAFAAAALRATTRSRGLSFGDRACLALAAHLKAPALTADRAWQGLKGVELIR